MYVFTLDVYRLLSDFWLANANRYVLSFSKQHVDVHIIEHAILWTLCDMFVVDVCLCVCVGDALHI